MKSPTESERVLPPHLSAACGFLMGGADAIPGVSGGTIALIIGVYDRFIHSLSTMVKSPLLLRTAEGRGQIKRALMFLVPLAIGLVAAYYLATKLLIGPTDKPGVMRRPDTAPICYAFFFGLVLLSLREPWKRIDNRTVLHFGVAAAGCAAAAIFVGLPHTGAEPARWMLVLGGAGAIAVMLLPGVSGSLFLVIIGQYATVAGAVHDRDIGTLLVFMLGMGLGVVFFVPFLRLLLDRYHDLTMAALTGLMAGSLRALWPWKSGYEPKEAPMINQGIGDDFLLPLVAFVAGGAVVWLLAQFERRIEGENPESPS